MIEKLFLDKISQIEIDSDRNIDVYIEINGVVQKIFRITHNENKTGYKIEYLHERYFDSVKANVSNRPSGIINEIGNALSKYNFDF